MKKINLFYCLVLLCFSQLNFAQLNTSFCLSSTVIVNTLDDLNLAIDNMVANSSILSTTIVIEDGIYESSNHPALIRQINTSGECPCKIKAENDNQVTLKGKLLWRMYDTENLFIEGINFEKTVEATRGLIEMYPLYGSIKNIEISKCNFNESGLSNGLFRHYIQAIDVENLDVLNCNFSPQNSRGHYLDFRNITHSSLNDNTFQDFSNPVNATSIFYVRLLDVSDTSLEGNVFSTKYSDGHYVYVDKGYNNVFKENSWQEDAFFTPSNDTKSYLYLFKGGHHTVNNNNFLDKYSKGNMLDLSYFGDVTDPNNNSHLILDNLFDGMVLVNGPSSMIKIGGCGNSSDTSSTNSNIAVQGNTFRNYNNVSNPLEYMEVISNKSSSNTYKNNLFENCRGGLFLRCGDNVTVENNRFIGISNGKREGITIYGDNHKIFNNHFLDITNTSSFPIILGAGNNNDPSTTPTAYDDVTNCKIAFNTFVNCQFNMFFNLDPSIQHIMPSNNYFDNNIFYQNSSNFNIPFIALDSDYSPTNTNWATNDFRNNIFYENNTVPHLIITSGYSLTSSSPDGNFDDNVDPLLVEVGGIYKPSSSSIALNAAYNVNDFYSFVSYDILGNNRGLIKDIGCFEVNSNNLLSTTKSLDKKYIVYPNPSQDFISIDLNNKNNSKTGHDITIFIKDLRGKVFLKKTVKDFKDVVRLDLRNYPKGYYIVSLIENTRTETLKIIKR